MLYYIIYKTTNILNGKYYIGKHITENLNDEYIGSGIALKKAIQKYGKEYFKKEILYIFDNELQMNETEKKIVNCNLIKNEGTYNIALGGNGGCIVLTETHPLRDQTIKKIKQSTNTDENKQKRRELAIKNHQSKKIGMYGKKQTQHQKETVSKALSGRNITWGEKISKALKGRRSQNKGKKLNLTEEQRKLRSERHKGKIPWNKGKKHSIETKNKISAKAKMRVSKAHTEIGRAHV